MPTFRPKTLTHLLPATPVTKEMREGVEQVAIERGVSIAEVQRKIIGLFLSKSTIKTIDEDINSSENDLG